MQVRLGLFARGVALLCAALLVTSAASTVFAAGVVGTGTAASCTDAALDTALAGGGLVTFNCGPDPVTIDISPPGTGTKTIATDTTINGGGLITIVGENVAAFSFNFSVNSGVKFTVENLTIAYGSGISNGGTLIVTSSTFSNCGRCIVNQDGSATVISSTFNIGGIDNFSGTLIVTSSTFSNGPSVGSAIFNEGMLTVTDSTFSGNLAYLGGAISNIRGTLIVTNSTFSANRTFGIDSLSGGGAIANRNGTVSVSNSTFSGNSALDGGSGGAILSFSDDGFSGGILTVTNCTFSGNDDGIVNSGGTASVSNSIIASGCFSITDGGHNIDDGTSCGFSPANGSLSNTDAQLDPAGLRDNGGPTQTVALCTGVGVPAGCTGASPAIDAGDPTVCAAAPVSNRDQRGLARPGTGHTQCSIGAYEADVIPPEACTGDCDGNGVVAINELILGVNIVLGVQPTCSAFANTEGIVDIAQLIKGVNNALGGCGFG